MVKAPVLSLQLTATVVLLMVLSGCSLQTDSRVLAPVYLDRTTPQYLRGNPPKVGQKTLQCGALTLNDGTMTVSHWGKQEQFAIDQRTETEDEEEVLAVEGDRETKLRTRFLREQHTGTIRGGGRPETYTKTGTLVGREVESVFTDKKWTHNLVGEPATIEQAAELASFPSPILDVDFFPDGDVRPGHQWELDAKCLARNLGSNVSVESGSLTILFMGTRKIDGVTTAQFREQLEIKATIRDLINGTEHISIQLAGHATLSLDAKRRLTHHLGGTLESKRHTTEKSHLIEIRITGPITHQMTSQAAE